VCAAILRQTEREGEGREERRKEKRTGNEKEY